MLPVINPFHTKNLVILAAKRVTSAGDHEWHDSAPRQHSSEETSDRWRAIGDAVSDLTGQEIRRKTSCASGD